MHQQKRYDMKKKKTSGRITMDDFVKAVKKADREIQLHQSVGFQSHTQVHKSKKIYDRKEGKKIDFGPSFFVPEK